MLLLKQFIPVNADEFIYVLRNSCQKEAKHYGVDDAVLEDIISGFVYYKNLQGTNGKDVRVRVEVTEYIPLEKYVVLIKTGDTEYYTTYSITQETDGIFLEYKENSKSEKVTRNWNYSLMTWITQRGKKKKICTMLLAIKGYILENRSKIKGKIERMNQADALVQDQVSELIGISKINNRAIESDNSEVK